MRDYTDHTAQPDRPLPDGFAPEDHWPADIQRTERLRHSEICYWLAENWIVNGVRFETVADSLMPTPDPTLPKERQKALRLEQARLASDQTVCSMPVRGCRDHGDTLVWREGHWNCRTPGCDGGALVVEQRRHCPFEHVAVIDYPSGHRRRVCFGHMTSEYARWAEEPSDATIRITPRPVAPDTASPDRR